jgi:hypothetical protein
MMIGEVMMMAVTVILIVVPLLAFYERKPLEYL